VRDAVGKPGQNAARAVVETLEPQMTELPSLPDDLPEPVDDGAADHLPGLAMPAVTLPATDGRTVDLTRQAAGRTVVYVYPLTGKPGADLPRGWDEIPGARGCTPEACGFRDHYQQLRDAGADAVYGLSSQDTEYQREAAARLRLPFAMLSDQQHRMAAALGLPTFEADGLVLYIRLTLIVNAGAIERVFYPVFPPYGHAGEVLEWLRHAARD
jgi:peroxiredoxin